MAVVRSNWNCAGSSSQKSMSPRMGRLVPSSICSAPARAVKRPAHAASGSAFTFTTRSASNPACRHTPQFHFRGVEASTCCGGAGGPPAGAVSAAAAAVHMHGCVGVETHACVRYLADRGTWIGAGAGFGSARLTVRARQLCLACCIETLADADAAPPRFAVAATCLGRRSDRDCARRRNAASRRVPTVRDGCSVLHRNGGTGRPTQGKSSTNILGFMSQRLNENQLCTNCDSSVDTKQLFSSMKEFITNSTVRCMMTDECSERYDNKSQSAEARLAVAQHVTILSLHSITIQMIRAETHTAEADG